MRKSTQALIKGREHGKVGNVNANPYDRRKKPKLWEQYERGFTAGKSLWVARRAVAKLRR